MHPVLDLILQIISHPLNLDVTLLVVSLETSQSHPLVTYQLVPFSSPTREKIIINRSKWVLIWSLSFRQPYCRLGTLISFYRSQIRPKWLTIIFEQYSIYQLIHAQKKGILDNKMIDHDTGRSRGFGFVTFESEDIVEHQH